MEATQIGPLCAVRGWSRARLIAELRREYETSKTPIVISGQIGPRGDGYKAGRMDVGEAEAYHAAQIAAFVESEADMVGAYTMNTVEEAIGIARAAKAARIRHPLAFRNRRLASSAVVIRRA